MGFWDTVYSTTLATAVGGIIAAWVGFWFSKRSSAISATYDAVKHIISDDFTSKRQVVRDYINAGNMLSSLCYATSGDRNNFTVRTNILYILNYYDTIMNCVKDGAMDGKVIKDTVWKHIILDDHIQYEEFIAEYSKKNQINRPLFPALRSYRNIWN